MEWFVRMNKFTHLNFDMTIQSRDQDSAKNNKTELFST